MARRSLKIETEDTPQVEAVPVSVPPTTPAPAKAEITFAQALANLQAANAIYVPARDKTAQAAKAAKVAAAGKIVADMQQGLPTVDMTADKYAAGRTETADSLRLTRLKFLARTNLDVAWILKQKDLPK